jgi:hypothetical protein
MSGMAEPKQANPVFELHVVLGLRAMLGDQKVRKTLEKAKVADPEGFKRAMTEAEARYAALSEEAKQNPAQTLNALVATSAQLRARMIFAGGPRGLLMSIPRAVRQLLWK